MSDIKMHDSLTSDDINIDGLNLENLNSLNNLVNLNIDSDLSDDILPSLKNTLQQQSTQEQSQPQKIQQSQQLQSQPQQRPQSQQLQPQQRPQSQQSQPQQRPQSQPQQRPQSQQLQPQQRPQSQQLQPQQRPQSQQSQQTQQTQQTQQIQQKTEPNLIQQKQVSFNEQIEQKIITPTPEENANIQPQILEDIKKIKIGKLLIPQTTLFFTIILAVIGSILFYTTRPKPKK
jgi:DNA mismatch repair ATPase MutL